MKLIKKTLMSAVVVSSLVASTAALASPTSLHTDNYSRFYIASEVGGFCSTLFGIGSGVTGPGNPGEATASWSQVTELCKSSTCTATIKAFNAAPPVSPTCPGGTTIATATMNVATGEINFNSIASGWTLSNSVSGATSTVTIHGSTAK